MKIKIFLYRVKYQVLKYYKIFLLILKLCLSLNKYFNLFNFLFIIWIKPLDLDLFNGLIEGEDSDTKNNYKWWLEKLLLVAMAVVTFYILYKVASNGTDISGSIQKIEPVVPVVPVEVEIPSLLDREKYDNFIFPDEPELQLEVEVVPELQAEVDLEIINIDTTDAGPIITTHW